MRTSFPYFHWLLTLLLAPFISHLLNGIWGKDAHQVVDMLEAFPLALTFSLILSLPAFLIYLVSFYYMRKKRMSPMQVKVTLITFAALAVPMTMWLTEFDGQILWRWVVEYDLAVVFVGVVLPIKKSSRPERQIAAILLLPLIFFMAKVFGDRDGKARQEQMVELARKEQAVKDSIMVEKGLALFKDSCGVCHFKDKSDNLFLGVVDRVGVARLKLFLTKQDSLVAGKDSSSLALKRNWGNLDNSHNFHYTDAQLDTLITFLAKAWK